jgi:uncharacterized phage-associated protein
MDDKVLYFANSIIHWGKLEGASLTPLKIQKLLYLFYSRCYALQQKPPFAERFEKWQYGPVLRRVYDCLRPYGGQTVTVLIPDSEGRMSRLDIENSEFKEAFDETMRNFGRKSARELVCITHGEETARETAWAKAAREGDFLDDECIRADGEALFV